MTEQQYRALCTACDRLLLAPDSTIERVATTWLHVVREHPVFLAQYADLFEPAPRFVARRAVRRARAVAGRLRRAMRGPVSEPLWYGPASLPSETDVLFVSHLVSAAQAGQEDDFYFGPLPGLLRTRGHSSVVALLNQTTEPGEELAARYSAVATPRVVLAGQLATEGDARVRRRAREQAAALRRHADRAPTTLDRRVALRAADEMATHAPHALRIGEQIAALVAAIRPRMIVVTYEGHAWERVAFAAARSAIPGIRCVGYQHAALFRLQHAVGRSLGPAYDPDHVLTAGTVTRRQLEKSPDLRETPIAVLGSHRAPAAASDPRAAITPASRRACLVMPEGILSECHLMFEFSLACAAADPETRFIWRLHPIVSFDTLASANPTLRHRPSNVEISTGDLTNDLARCAWALYRGSTTAIPAVLAGLRPLYLDDGGLSVDSFSELTSWRKSVASASDFVSVVRDDLDTAAGDLARERAPAEAYCREYFRPLDVDVFIAALDAAEPVASRR